MSPSITPEAVVDHLGHQVDTIDLNIDYTIIEHFSKHLYSSPNKAIEELVVNGYDAAAREVHVYLPGSFAGNAVAIWDDGNSMDVQGLKDLWAISDSPKRTAVTTTVTPPRGVERKVIGKFGIGKIASYTLGDLISHICRRGDKYLGVKVDYKELLKKGAPGQLKHVEIVELSSAEVDELLTKVFRRRPEAFERMRAADSWTLAIIEDLKHTSITPGRLKWVLGNSMPLRPDFQIWVEEDEVTSALDRGGAAQTVDFSDPGLQENLRRKWDTANKDPDKHLYFGQQFGLDKANPTTAVPYVEFPEIGKVWGVVRLYHASLLSGDEPSAADEERRSYGFFIMVLDRLINDRDPKLFLKDPSFATFYRAQYVLHVDGLNPDLLADRERLQRDSPRVAELIILQKAVYSETVNWRAAFEREDASRATLQYRLPVHSRALFIEPVTAVLKSRTADNDVSSTAFLYKPEFDRKAMGEEASLTDFSQNNEKLVINTSHPFYQNISSLAGNGKKAAGIMREVELIAISETLFEGYLLDIGLEKHLVRDILTWRDRQYRIFAQLNRESPHTILSTFSSAVNNHNIPDFEKALVALLKSMGFEAELATSVAKSYVIMRAFDGEDSYTITFETQRKNEAAGVTAQTVLADAVAHQQEADASSAIIIVGDVTGFTDDDLPALIEECTAVGTVAIMRPDALLQLAQAMSKYFYSHGNLKQLFTAIELPEAKLTRVATLKAPFKHFDFNKLIDFVLEEHKRYGGGEPFAYRAIYNLHYKKGQTDPATGQLVKLTFDDFESKLQALAPIAEPHLHFDFRDKTVALGQAPEKVREAIAASLAEPEDASN